MMAPRKTPNERMGMTSNAQKYLIIMLEEKK